MNEETLKKEREYFFSENCVDIEKYNRDPVYHREITILEIQHMKGFKRGYSKFEEVVEKYSDLSEKYAAAVDEIVSLKTEGNPVSKIAEIIKNTDIDSRGILLLEIGKILKDFGQGYTGELFEKIGRVCQERNENV